jgi:hypothetical protein
MYSNLCRNELDVFKKRKKELRMKITVFSKVSNVGEEVMCVKDVPELTPYQEALLQEFRQELKAVIEFAEEINQEIGSDAFALLDPNGSLQAVIRDIDSVKSADDSLEEHIA